MRILITGGAGYVGTELVRHLLSSRSDIKINVLDTFWFWNSPDDYRKYILLGDNSKLNKQLSLFPADIRCPEVIRRAIRGCEQVINLACISNDPSSDLNPTITHSISYHGNKNIIIAAIHEGVERFIHASTSSVYGLKEEEKVTEELDLAPMTQYAKIKVSIESLLIQHYHKAGINPIILRPATVCGYSGRQRLDLVLNIFAYQAAIRREITVHGGQQYRPNINIADMVKAYEFMMDYELYPVNGQVFNVGDHNYTLLDLAMLVKEIAQKEFKIDVKINIEDSNDQRSYRLNSDKINALGFKCIHGLPLAIYSIMKAALANQWDTSKSSNIEVMKKVLNVTS